MWRAAVIDDTTYAYHRTVFAGYPAYARTAARWARAVTNKRIGFAVSGDGATSYRLVALLRLLEKAGIPIDVFGGVSGGANLGAYYCRDGADGLDQYVGQAGRGRSVVSALLASLTSQPIESGLDWAFSDTTLDDLEVRFLAITTALPECGPPESHVVVRGTLGAAVRASGSLPLFFARTIKGGVLYSDGALANPMPVRALPNYGADYVIACNSVPGPDNRNPLRQWPGFDALYRWSCLGPVIDVWVANAYSHQRRAEEAAAYADVAIAMTPNTLSLFEVMLWLIPEFLLDEAGRDERIQTGVDAVKQFWSRRKGT
jgi:predicted acylesterase/phospholipase RssA